MDQDTPNRPHTVYRLFGKHDRLLYIGCTSEPEKRVAQHRRKPWGGEISRVWSHEMPDRASALQWEREAIRTECPRYNQLSTNPGAFGEGTFQKELSVRNCTLLVGTEADTGRVRVSFIRHGDKAYDLNLAIKRAVKAARTIVRRDPPVELNIKWR